MDIRPKVRNAALVGALAAVAATAWATNDSMSYSTYSATDSVYAEQPAVTSSDTVVMTDGSLSPTETVVSTRDVSDARAVPVMERNIAQPGITVEERRLSEDERIQAVVMDKLANTQHLSGKIGVESHDAVVRLSGWTTTAGQADRASRAARSVIGVKYVQNEIRPRIGGSAS
jgi:osmotically-inducible protein OsmY